MDLVPFNPAERVEITQATLPHWQQARRTYFITWRTADSIPQKLLKAWKVEREAWLEARHVSLAQLETLSPQERREYRQRFTLRWHEFLDDCHGECLLRHADVRAVVGNALRHFDGQRYALGDFVLMPNHVHVLVTPLEEQDIQRLCFSWKRFSSGKINELLGRRGDFWQPESFDHIVRHEASLRRIQKYIGDNPSKARLREEEYTLHQPASWRRAASGA